MATRRSIKSISVDLEVMTTDRLRKVVFGLDKSTDGDEVTWAIEFRLFERETKTDEFGDELVKLDVEVKKTLHEQAEVTATKGLNKPQAEHLLGPASSTAKRFADGKTSEKTAKAAAERTLQKRDE